MIKESLQGFSLFISKQQELYTGDSVICRSESLNECVKGFFIDSWGHDYRKNTANAFKLYKGTSRKKYISRISTSKYKEKYYRDRDDDIYLSDYDTSYPEFFITSRNSSTEKVVINFCRMVLFEKCVFG